MSKYTTIHIFGEVFRYDIHRLGRAVVRTGGQDGNADTVAHVRMLAESGDDDLCVSGEGDLTDDSPLLQVCRKLGLSYVFKYGEDESDFADIWEPGMAEPQRYWTDTCGYCFLTADEMKERQKQGATLTDVIDEIVKVNSFAAGKKLTVREPTAHERAAHRLRGKVKQP